MRHHQRPTLSVDVDGSASLLTPVLVSDRYKGLFVIDGYVYSQNDFTFPQQIYSLVSLFDLNKINFGNLLERLSLFFF
jgi:hypothetical protein